MSYVIQNFSKLNYRFTTTPRLKTLVALRSINFFLFLFKFENFFKLNHLFYFFFSKSLVNFFYKLTSSLSGNYTNKLTITALYWNFKLLDNFLNNDKAVRPLPFNDLFYFYNLYFLSIKTINIKLSKTYFKAIYFFFIFFLSDFWYQFHTYAYFYLNFFFIRNNFKMYKFYNGYFLRVYNF